MSTYKETPEIAAAINELLLRYGAEPWWDDARQFIDDAGARILIKVVDCLYVEDVLPRHFMDAYIVVQRIDGNIQVEEPRFVGIA